MVESKQMTGFLIGLLIIGVALILTIKWLIPLSKSLLNNDNMKGDDYVLIQYNGPYKKSDDEINNLNWKNITKNKGKYELFLEQNAYYYFRYSVLNIKRTDTCIHLFSKIYGVGIDPAMVNNKCVVYSDDIKYFSTSDSDEFKVLLFDEKVKDYTENSAFKIEKLILKKKTN
ncbi:MAG: hypothetical protein QXG00_00295 [Candidatus Woesearchaeota archaeon]